MSTHYSVTSTLLYMLGVVVVLTLFSMFLTFGDRRRISADENQDSEKAKTPQSIKSGDHMHNEKKLERDLDKEGEDILVGNKRFKLYEKKKLNYEKAKKYCKAREGQLAKPLNIEEMRRLQILLMKSRSVSSGLWVQVDRKEWKKHSMKMTGRQNLGQNFAGEGMSAMMMGGGPTEMCPSLSVSTRSLQPENCRYDLPFVCEFPIGQIPKKNVSDKGNLKNERAKNKIPNGQGTANKKKSYDSTKKDKKKEPSNNSNNNKKKGANPQKKNVKSNNRNRERDFDRIKMGDFRANNRRNDKYNPRERTELKK